VSGQDGVDVEGYRDYRGIPVAGAWAWIPTLGIGIATEMDIDEAYAGLTLLRTRFGVVVGLLVLAALAMFLYSFVMVRLRREVDEARQLGRYRIERKLGSGGVGTVYLASHALLRRPTAIKVLKAGVAGVEGVARFEREVQVTSSLSHPNTIEIYDFGYTPDGTFYYAMEYLRGLTLGECVEDDGPQPEARVLHLMKQACASIAEAHAAGLIHRDLKPSNVMLCERGGLFDFVKVLDFGLVRAEQQSREVALTAVDSLTGTPLYMPPEAVQAPDTLDARADVYQLGEILYYLLTGRHVFVGDTAYDVLAQHVASVPEAPSAALGRSVSPDLERIVLWCLEKKPAARPRDAGSLLEALEGSAATGTWGRREAQDWWRIWRERHPGSDDLRSTPGGSTPSSYGIDLAARLRDT
jgi:serine/threonine protein kinase